MWNSHQPIGDERCFDLGPALVRKTLIDLHTKDGPSLEKLLPFVYQRPGLSDVDKALIDWAKKLGAKPE